MRWAVFYFAPFLLFAAALTGLLELGSSRHYQVLTGFLLIFLPLDLLFGAYRRDLAPEEPASLRQRQIFRLVTWAWAPFALALLVWTLWVVANKDPNWVQFLGFVLTTGFINGVVGIVFAHELMHRSNVGERALGEFYMTLVSYPHFCQEHVYGHHRKVATPEDPATARYGESLYRFLPRYIGGEFVSAWRLERQRLSKRGRRIWSPRNRVLRQLVTLSAIYALIAVFFGWQGVVLMAGQSVFAVFLLGVINYIEHYGLRRKEVAPGRYEQPGPQHSWDSSNLLTNLFLLNLGRHSDHHLRPGRNYQHLRHRDDAARLPFGYPAMLVLALVPPLFFRVMNPRVEGRRYVAERLGQAA